MDNRNKHKHINNLNNKIKKRQIQDYIVQNQKWTFVFLLWVGGRSGSNQTSGNIEITVTGIKHIIFQTGMF